MAQHVAAVRLWAVSATALLVSTTVSAPFAAAQPPAAAAATITAPASVTPGRQAEIVVSATACAGAGVTLSQRYATTHVAVTSHRIGTVTADSAGAAKFTARTPSNAAKSAVGIPAYWLATSRAPECRSALAAVAARSTITSLGTAHVSVHGSATKPHVTVTDCQGGLADVHVDDVRLNQTPLLGLHGARRTVSATVNAPKGSAALFVDCAQATVPSYSRHGIKLHGAKALTATAQRSAPGSQTPGQIAMSAQATCVPGPTVYRWPLQCGDAQSLGGLIAGLVHSPSLELLDERVSGSDLITAKLSHLADLAQAYPGALASKSAATLAPAASGSKQTHQSTVHDSDSSSTNSTWTTSDGSEGIAESGTSTTTVTGDEAAKNGMREIKASLTITTHMSLAHCPDGDGKLRLALDFNYKLSISSVDRHGRKKAGEVTGHASVEIVPRVDDAAAWTDFAVAATAEVSGRMQRPPGPKSEWHAGWSHTYPMHNPDDIQKELVDKNFKDQSTATAFMNSISSYGPDGARTANGATNMILGAVAMLAIFAPQAAQNAYATFHNSGGCFTDTWTGDTTVAPSSKHTYTVTTTPKAGGAMSTKATLSPRKGAVDPTKFILHAGKKESFSFTAPGSTGPVTISLDGTSKRGVVRASLTVQVGALTATLTYSASVSYTDSCTDNLDSCAALYSPNPGGTASNTQSVAGSLSGSAKSTLTSSDSGATGSPATGTVHEKATDDTYSWSVTDGNGGFGNIGPCPAANGAGVDTHGGFHLADTRSGPLRITRLSLTGKKDEDGDLESVAAINLTYALDASDGTSAGETVDWDMQTTAPSQCVGSNSGSYDNEDVVGGVFATEGTITTTPPDQGITVAPSRWKIDKSWTAAKGGTLATATVKLTYVNTSGALSSNYTTTEKFSLTTPSGG